VIQTGPSRSIVERRWTRAADTISERERSSRRDKRSSLFKSSCERRKLRGVAATGIEGIAIRPCIANLIRLYDDCLSI
jgi:hypothetical protein